MQHSAEPVSCPLPGTWEYCAHLSDDFPGDTLDGQKWWPADPDWLGRQPGLFRPENIRVADDYLTITTQKEEHLAYPEGYHTYTCGAIKSKQRVRYGYFEVRCQPMASHASSGFWLYAHEPEQWTEIDVFEIFAATPGHARLYHMNAHVFHTPTESEHWETQQDWAAPFALAEDFHRYGMLWTSEKIAWYADGQLIRTIANTHWHQPLNIVFDSEIFTGHPWGLDWPKDEELPATFTIDYIRVWQQAAGEYTHLK